NGTGGIVPRLFLPVQVPGASLRGSLTRIPRRTVAHANVCRALMPTRHAQRLINGAILLASLLPYLEWGGGNAAFVGQMEYELLLGGSTSPDTFLHPMVALPLAGQLLVLIPVFQRTPSRRMTTIGVLLLSLL